MVDVGVHSEHSFEYGFDDLAEGFGEGDPDLTGEDGLVVELGLDPGHEQVDVLWGWNFKWCAYVLPISP